MRMAAAQLRKFIDIGANLTDPMYQGVYHRSKKHQPDLDVVLQRAWDHGLDKIIITGGSLHDSKEALNLAQTNDRLFCTVGCHPTRCGEFESSGDPKGYVCSLVKLAEENRAKVVAFGEMGLDYDRTKFCPKDVQLKYLAVQLEAASSTTLPLFLHCRGEGAATDLHSLLSSSYLRSPIPGVVHSFDGSESDASLFMDLGLHIGINGCSLRTATNLECVSKLPSDRLLLETDCPWCEIKPTHSGAGHVTTKFGGVKKEKWTPGCLVKGRNEPVHITQVLEIVAAVKKEVPDDLCQTIYNTTNSLFFGQ